LQSSQYKLASRGRNAKFPPPPGDHLSSGNVLPLFEEEQSMLASLSSDAGLLVEAVGVVGLQKKPLEPLLAPHLAAGLEHTLRKDPHFVDGPYRPHLMGLEMLGVTPLPREVLPLLVMPCGAMILRSQRAPECFSSLLPQGNGSGIYLHCFLRYREEPSEGVWLPEALFIATRWGFHLTLSKVLRLFAEGIALHGRVDEAWGPSHAQALATLLAVDPPAPGKPLYLQVREQAVHVQRPVTRDLPLADIDFAVLFSWLDLALIQRILVLLILAEPRMLMVADEADVLFPIIQALVSLVYPFKWRNTLIPNLPATWIMELDAPYPFFLGITRPALPRGRVPTENVCQVDATHKTISLPPKVAAVEDSEAGRCLAQLIGEAFTVFEADVRKCVADFGGHGRGAAAASENFETLFEGQRKTGAPGAWGSSSADSAGGALHGCVDGLRNGLCSKFASVLFCYPLFVNVSGGVSSKRGALEDQRWHDGGATQDACVQLDVGALMCASDCPALLLAMSKTQMISHLVLSRIHLYASTLGLPLNRGRLGKGHRDGEEEEAFDVFDAHVQRRLESEAQLVGDIERSGHICGFLFVQVS
jgi:hypothetical protein